MIQFLNFKIKTLFENCKLIIKKPRYEIVGVAKRKNINLNTVFYSYICSPHSPGFPTGFAGKFIILMIF